MMRLITLLATLVNVKAEGRPAITSPAAPCRPIRCTCIGRPTVADARKRSRDIALVETIARRDTTQSVADDGRRSWSTPAYVVTFRVHARWQGMSSDTLEIVTMRDDGMCGVAFELGAQYVVFTEGTTGVPTVNRCSLTALASRSAQTLRALGVPSAAR